MSKRIELLNELKKLVSDERINQIIEELRKPITLTDFLGWEEGVEYEEEYGDIYKIEDGNLYKIYDSSSKKHVKEILHCDFGYKNINWLRSANKPKAKTKAYHVKDKYSYDCLMEELEEQGYKWFTGACPTQSPYEEKGWSDFVIFCHNDKRLTFDHLGYFKIYYADTYELIECHKEEPKFYAKIKGWKLLTEEDLRLFYFTKTRKGLILSGELYNHNSQIFTKSKWNELGINDTNADFEEAQE